MTRLSLCSDAVNPRKTRLIDEYAVGDSLLDVGCGNGLYPLTTSRRFNRILQLDVVDRRSDAARHLPFCQMDASLIGNLQAAFSTALCFDIIEHLDDDVAFLTSLRSVCTGVVIGSVPNEDDSQPQLVGLTYMHHTDKTHRRNYGVARLEEIFRHAGFSEVCVLPQYADGLIAAAYALRTESLLSKVAAKLITIACRGLCRAGLFRNRAIADWFFVAR